MQCPRCRKNLDTVRLSELSIELCPGCEGSFYDFGELSRVFAHSEGQVLRSRLRATLVAEEREEIDLDRPAECPRCGQAMERNRYLSDCPVVVDQCPQHGVWLDDGELGRLMDHLAETVGDGKGKDVGTAIRSGGGGLLAALRRLFG
ncbi:MAG: zf-TFIIB domain-containing protein [Armatimonadetes bacterium]|nr:zf-TFIIB domain-containing protein [Armatimonadota bacterium]